MVLATGYSRGTRPHCCDLDTRVLIDGLSRCLTLRNCSVAAWREAVFLVRHWRFVLCLDPFLRGFLSELHLECRELL